MKRFLIETPDEIMSIYPKGESTSRQKKFELAKHPVNKTLIKEALLQPSEPGDPSFCFPAQDTDEVKVIELMEEQTNFRAIPLRRLYKELCDISYLCDDLEKLGFSGFKPIIQLVKMEKQKRLRVCINRIKNTSLRKLMTHIPHIPASPSPNDVEEGDSRLGLAEWRFRLSNGKEKDFYSLFGRTKLRNLYKLLEEEDFLYVPELREEILRRLSKSK